MSGNRGVHGPPRLCLRRGIDTHGSPTNSFRTLNCSGYGYDASDPRRGRGSVSRETALSKEDLDERMPVPFGLRGAKPAAMRFERQAGAGVDVGR